MPMPLSISVPISATAAIRPIVIPVASVAAPLIAPFATVAVIVVAGLAVSMPFAVTRDIHIVVPAVLNEIDRPATGFIAAAQELNREHRYLQALLRRLYAVPAAGEG